ncbi:unnamed protein product [Polarella glacialis]|uniref:Uncharacterized protein n=1 Tax=Polarella glacialis TaxID=89957 RepID=A0A813G2K2_POLGL|nr:unnamed protein product [Polarella glacialis]
MALPLRFALCCTLCAAVARALAAPTAGGVPHLVENITVYRVTPLNYTGVTNMDAGDVRGDLVFGIFGLILPFVCPDFPDQVNCKNTPILSIPGFNVYTEFVVEVDTRFGEYLMCNPDPDTGIFSCAAGPDGWRGCWYDNPQWHKDFASLCSPQVSVLRQALPQHQ